MADLLQPVQESGFPLVDRLIHLFVGGSELHGAKVQGTDDLDIYGLLRRAAGDGGRSGLDATLRLVRGRQRAQERAEGC